VFTSVVHRGLCEHVRYATRLSVMSHLDTSDVENRLRQNCDAIVLKQHVSWKAGRIEKLLANVREATRG